MVIRYHMPSENTNNVEVLILGAGWTSKFLIPLLKEKKIKYAATTTTGHDDTIPFKFDPDSDDLNPYKILPEAKTIMITFPLKGEGQSKQLVESFNKTHKSQAAWVQLGSTGIYTQQEAVDHRSPYMKNNPRAMAEDELLGLKDCQSTVFNLAGLYDDEIRRPRNWVSRVAKSKRDVFEKKAVHLVHGKDVARAVVAAHENFSKVQGQRWILTDLLYYDWWFLIMHWGGELSSGEDLRQVVGSCMEESGTKVLPRETAELGRIVSSLDVWKTLGIMPCCFSVL